MITDFYSYQLNLMMEKLDNSRSYDEEEDELSIDDDLIDYTLT